jgi:hypothetical protein
MAFDPPEIEAITSFVRNGGSLVAIGDHTDLFGMNERLNAITSAFGITFRSDSSSDGITGGFNEWRPSSAGNASRHPVTLGLDHLQFMTPCTLQLSGTASPVIWVDGQTADTGDPANSSGFGALHNELRSSLGPKVFVAEALVGDGVILAIADSTPFASFALFDRDRDRFLLNAIDYLGAGSWRDFRWKNCVALLGLAFAISWTIVRRAWANTLPSLLVLAVVAFTLVGGPGQPPPARPAPASEQIRTLTIDRFNSGVAYPQTIGENADDYAAMAYDSLVVLFAKLGFLPRMLWQVRGQNLGAVHVILCPDRALPRAYVSMLANSVLAGNSVLFMVRSYGENRYSSDAVAAMIEVLRRKYPDIRRYGMDVEGLPLTASRYVVGSGEVIMLSGAERLSRKALGHPFSLPDFQQLTVMSWFGRLLNRSTERFQGQSPDIWVR